MIYICIPALNEARTIGVLLWKIRQVMDEFPRDYQVLVVDDGSTDDTGEVLEPYLRILPVTVLRNERTQGYAAAIERLIREAVHRSTHPKRDVVVTMQADFTESPDDIPLLLKKVEGGADVVAAEVTRTEGELPRGVRWSRRGLPWLLSRAALPKEIKDPLTGFRAYRVAILKRALQDRDGRPLLTRHGWAANAELLLCVAPHARRAEGAEVSIHYARRERPTRFSAWSTAMELWHLARKAPRGRPAPTAASPSIAPSPPPPSAEQPRTARAAAPAPAVAVAPAAADHAAVPRPADAPKRRRPPRRKPAAAQGEAGGQQPSPVPAAVTAEGEAAPPSARKRRGRSRRSRRPKGAGQGRGGGEAGPFDDSPSGES